MQTIVEKFSEAARIRAKRIGEALPDVRVKEGAGCEGMYILTLADIVTEEAREWEKQAAAARDRGDSKSAKGWMNLLNNKYGQKPVVVHNLVPTVGRAVLASRLSNDTTYTGVINKVALGSGVSTPVNADTTLDTEVYRNNAASLESADNIAYITGFFTAAEVSGTFGEVGLFIDGAAGADTGQLFSRALASITKTGIQTLTVDWIITIS